MLTSSRKSQCVGEIGNGAPETMANLIAGGVGAAEYRPSDWLLENEHARGVFGPNDMFLPYLYCLNGSVEKADALIADGAAAIKRDWLIDWP
jgi:hypothetical protein